MTRKRVWRSAGLLAAMLAVSFSIPLGAASGKSSAGPGEQVWREPHGRFSITIPAGWKVEDGQQNLKITQGTNWATFDTISRSGEPLDVAINAASQMKPFVQEWTIVNEGPFTTPRQHPAAGLTASGMVATRSGPPHKQTFLFTALSAGSGNFVVMTASTEFAAGRPPITAIMQAFDTIRFAGE